MRLILKAKKEFWIANILGWLSFYILNSFFQTNYFQNNYDAFFYSAIISVFGFTISVFHRWVLIQIIFKKKFIPTVLFSFVIMLFMSFIEVVITSAINDSIYNNYSLDFDSLVGNWLNSSLILFIWTLIYISYVYFEKQRKLAVEKLELALELKEAELTNLKNQLSPHFLFNAINNIRSLILINPEKARSALMDVSDLLRYALNYQKNNYVSVEEELEIVNSYIELNKIHLRDNVEFILNVDKSILHFKIPPMSIQLLLENAIKHGEIKNKSKVKINIEKKQNNIEIEVVNPGKFKHNKNEGIGLKNLEQRLKSMYKERVTFSIFEKNNYVFAQIKITHD